MAIHLPVSNERDTKNATVYTIPKHSFRCNKLASLRFAAMGAKVHILVYVGDPVDLSPFRHAGLYVELDRDTKNRGRVFHITGASGIYRYEERPDYNPEASMSLYKRIRVAELPSEVPESSFRSIIATTRIRNEPEERDWNCQSWVCDALQRLVNQGWLSKEDRESSIDQMVDACLEAKDEEF